MSVQRRKRPQRGQTLLELVGATTILAVALVPALRLMRDSVRVVGDLGTSNLLATLCVSKLEEHLQKTAADWSTVSVSGDYAAEGYAGLRFTVVRSDAAADGGIPGSLMSIVVTSWEDRTVNGTPDTGEPRVGVCQKPAHRKYHHGKTSRIEFHVDGAYPPAPQSGGRKGSSQPPPCTGGLGTIPPCTQGVPPCTQGG